MYTTSTQLSSNTKTKNRFPIDVATFLGGTGSHPINASRISLLRGGSTCHRSKCARLPWGRFSPVMDERGYEFGEKPTTSMLL